MGKSVIFSQEFCNAAVSHFMRNEGETRDNFYSRFLKDPYLISLYPDDSERGIAADARWMELQNAPYHGQKMTISICPRCLSAVDEVDTHTGYCKKCQMSNTILEWTCPECGYTAKASSVYDEKICQKCGSQMTPDRKPMAQRNAEPIKNILETAVQNGLISNSDMQKLVTRDGFPKTSPPIKFLMPGLVEYEYMNNGEGARVLVTKKAIDKMLNDLDKSIVGKPVINIAHRDVSPDDYKNGKADGVVTRAWYDAQEGWYCCEALIWDEDTRQNLLTQSVSCEYTALPPWGPAGTLNQVAYDKEVTDGRFKHLAVVAGPRYEGAKLMNSTGGNKTMKLFQWLKKGNEEVKNSVEVDDRTAIVTEDGKEVLLTNAMAAYREVEAAKAAKAKADAEALLLQNAKVLKDDDVVTIDGKPVKVADLKNAMAEKAKNASEEKMEKDHKDGEHKGKEMDNCPMCNAEEDEDEEKKKKEKDAENAVLMNSQHRLGLHPIPNEKCAICDGIENDRLQNAAKRREGKLPNPGAVPSINDGLRRGKELMGRTQAQQEAADAAAK